MSCSDGVSGSFECAEFAPFECLKTRQIPSIGASPKIRLESAGWD